MSDSPMWHRDEKTLSVYLSTALRTFLSRATIEAERSQVLEDGGQPDLVVDAPGREPVLIENKYDSTANAAALELQCQKRLDTFWIETGNPVRIAVALLIPIHYSSDIA